MEQNELIGKTVLSVDFGAGVITEISDLNMGAQDFYIIQLGGSDGSKSFVPVTRKPNFRVLTSADDFHNALNKFDKSREDFENKKDRINYYKDSTKKSELSNIIQNTYELYSIGGELSSAENIVLNKLVDSLSLEYSLLHDMTIDDSKEHIETHFRSVS